MKIKGIKVVDADDHLDVTITRADIRKGSIKNARSCAAAVALCRQEHCEEAHVHLARTYVKKGNRWVRYFTPPALRAEIIAFDRGGNFEPGDYSLKPVQPILHFGNPARKKYMKAYRKQSPSSRKTPQTGRRSSPHVVKGVRDPMKPERGGG